LAEVRTRLSAAFRYGAASALALQLCGTASGQQAAPAPPTAGQVLVMSDLHFDPMADPRLVDQLAAAEPEQWSAVLDDSGDRSLGRYGRDSNWMLLHSALQHMAETIPKPAFVLISGDFLAHGFRQKFDATAADHSDAAYRIFVRKTMQFLARQLGQTFQATPILPTLGNNDEECGDYQLQPKGEFLARTLPILYAFLGSSRLGLDENWKSNGNYSVKAGGIRVLSANTNFFSIHYRNACGSADDPDPGRATLAWLETELAAARQARERVWLMYHIPPGIDGYATLRLGECPGKMIPMWREDYAEPFFALTQRYADTIAASFAGHTHMDDFRLLGDADGPYGFALITPAVSPIFGQNPAFRTLIYDDTGGILDQTTYDLTNLPEATAAGGASPAWHTEYTFTQQWSLPRVDVSSLQRLYALTGDMPADTERWHNVFSVSSPIYWAQFPGGNEQLERAVLAFRCATGNVLTSRYQQCYCGGK
jgi:sphingomyelin phosphodiesterase acid-like 3